MAPEQVHEACAVAAELISLADGLLITAGAGMGIDSGLPDFRGIEGFWRAYPALGRQRMRFAEIASPRAFRSDPLLAWGFYGHRLQLYRDTQPHAGFQALLGLSNEMPNGAFVFTSNVDGQFQKAGFAATRIAECHGSIHRLQCIDNCGQAAWSADRFLPQVDAASGTLQSDLPTCPCCGGLARPNILMFGDGGWDGAQAEAQFGRLRAWIARAQRPVVVELGAGTAIPTVRMFGEGVGCPLIRINPDESGVAMPRDVSVPLGAKDGILGILAALHGEA